MSNACQNFCFMIRIDFRRNWLHDYFMINFLPKKCAKLLQLASSRLRKKCTRTHQITLKLQFQARSYLKYMAQFFIAFQAKYRKICVLIMNELQHAFTCVATQFKFIKSTIRRVATHMTACWSSFIIKKQIFVYLAWKAMKNCAIYFKY